MRYTLYIVVFSLFLLFSCTSGSSIEFPSSPIGQANEFVLDQLSVSVSTPVKVPGDFFDVGDVINVNLNPVNSNPWLVYKHYYLYKVPDSGLGELVDNPLNGWHSFNVDNVPSCFDDDNFAYMNLQAESCCGGACQEVLVEFLDVQLDLPVDLETGSYLLLFAVGEAQDSGEWDVWNWVFEEIIVRGEDWCEPVPATCGSGDDQDVLTSCVDNHLISSECENSCLDFGDGVYCGCFDTEQDPIPLCNCVDLQRMNEDVTANYELQNDIDCSDTVNWDDNDDGVAEGFNPIHFSGVFDGQDHVIRNLFINQPIANYVGLFGSNAGTVRDVGIEGGEIKGSAYVGGLIGQNFRGSISNSYAIVDVSGCTKWCLKNKHGGVGGLTGNNLEGSISGSYATGSVRGDQRVGGLAGNNFRGSISGSYATGSVSGGRYGGGLAGQNFQGSISGSYATGSVSGGADVGGLVGYNREGTTISGSYASGSVRGGQRVGGLAGLNSKGGSISGSYASGSVSGSWFAGGLVGSNSRGVISSSFWDTESSSKFSSAGGDGKTTSELKDRSTYPSSWDFNTLWAISPDVNDGYPHLQSFDQS